MQNIKSPPRREAQRQRLAGILREIHRHQDLAIWAPSRPLDDQHRPLSFTHNLFCCGAQKQRFQEVLAVCANHHKITLFLSRCVDEFYEGLTCRDANGRGNLIGQGKRADLLARCFLSANYELSSLCIIACADVASMK
jgi:hypothetical protein